MSYSFEKTVLDMHAPYYSLPCQIGNTGLSADSDGKKIIKAGTPVGNLTTDVLLDRTAVLISTNDSTNGAKSQGVLVHDVDVTNGNATGTVAFMGVIDLAKTDVIVNSAVVLPRIIFMKGRAF